ncbi:Rhs element Vgr protein [Yersinia pekkanenii]|uniref:Rhs element Vgr protein n=2 Tax=Yersinia pekkanenii TaxID=1288385 RepID=A0ABM9U0B2_9GAMM|nr:Rhs element Vgr protein [Yersinia pekkanenii]
MNLTNTLQNTLSKLTGTTLNRYRLDIPSCLSPLDVEDFSGNEGLSNTYHYNILFTSTDKNIDADQLLRKPATLTMGTGLLQSLMEQKVVHGVITDFRRISGSADQVNYQITLEPFIALLDNQYRTHRFFVNKSVPSACLRRGLGCSCMPEPEKWIFRLRVMCSMHQRCKMSPSVVQKAA